jgi:hypothetical protein
MAAPKIIKYKGQLYRRAGYMGMEHWTASDTAADLMSDVRDAAAKILAKAINVDHGPYNTPGAINVLLCAEALFGKEAIDHGEDLAEIVGKALNKVIALRDKATQQLAKLQGADTDNTKGFIKDLNAVGKRVARKFGLTY